jgi:hypothetical protein
MNLVELKQLLVKELSAVDSPANTLDGWAVMKSRSRFFPNDEAILKAADVRAAVIPERMLSLAPVYAPNSVDFHGEHVSAQELEDAIMKFAESGDRRLLLQHGDHGAAVFVGTILSIFTWPYSHTVKLRIPGESERQVEMPPGSAYAWIRWSKDVWPLVKAGKGIRGLSIGGKALRVPSTEKHLPRMGDMAKAGRVFSQGNVDDLRECISVIEAIIARDPTAAAEAGYAKSKEGVLVVNEVEQCVYHLTPTSIEILGGGEFRV